MAKVFVIYDKKYGNTKLVAEEIAKGLRELEGIETSINDVKDIDIEEVADSDAILIGTPNHVGRPARTISTFIDKLGGLHLKAKWVAVFDTHMANDERAMKKIEKQLTEKVPRLKLITSSLPIRVEGMKGPITEGELPKCSEFGKRIANQLKT